MLTGIDLDIYLSLGFISYIASGIVYLFLLIVYFIGIRNRTNKAFFILIVATLVWSTTLTLSQIGSSLPFKLITITEFLRYFAWLHLLHLAAGYYIDRSTKY